MLVNLYFSVLYANDSRALYRFNRGNGYKNNKNNRGPQIYYNVGIMKRKQKKMIRVVRAIAIPAYKKRVKIQRRELRKLRKQKDAKG